MKTIFILISFLFVNCVFCEPIDLEKRAQDFILETKKINIPGYPHAFNPSIIRWKGSLLLSFRYLPDLTDKFKSELGLVWLDENFNPSSKPQILQFRDKHDPIPTRAEDARLIAVGDRLFIAYNDNHDPLVTVGGFRMYIAEIVIKNEQFHIKDMECLSEFEGASSTLREKNWTPFIYEGELLLAYSIDPHLIFKPIPGTGSCTVFSKSSKELDWEWGVIRGGTQALIVDNQYLGFFHSCKRMASQQSDNKNMLHYFIGAYTFSLYPPFDLTQISPKPIIGKGFYEGEEYEYYWRPIKAVFPCGYIFNKNYIWMTFGRQDHECWVVKIDLEQLLQSLIPVI